jgi:hypothetical protein
LKTTWLLWNPATARPASCQLAGGRLPVRLST